MHTLQITYQTVSVRHALTLLHWSNEKELTDFLRKDLQWSGVDVKDGVLQLPATKDNTMKPPIIQESLQFEQLTKILAQCR